MIAEDATGETPDLGDLVIVLLASTLSGLRDRLEADGFNKAATCVADATTIADDYLARVGSRSTR